VSTQVKTQEQQGWSREIVCNADLTLTKTIRNWVAFRTAFGEANVSSFDTLQRIYEHVRGARGIIHGRVKMRNGAISPGNAYASLAHILSHLPVLYSFYTRF